MNILNINNRSNISNIRLKIMFEVSGMRFSQLYMIEKSLLQLLQIGTLLMAPIAE